MKDVKNMVVLYFSGTGNSKFVAQQLAKQMDCACHSIEEDVDFSAMLLAANTVAFVYPIYASRMPRILREFIRDHQSDLLHKALIILATQMGFSGDGARCLTDLLEPGSYRVLYAEHITMPNNINNVAFFPRASQKRIEKLTRKAKDKVARIVSDINAGVVKKRGFNPGSRLLGQLQGSSAPGMERKALDKVKIGDECIGCGLCVKRCPMQNLIMEGGKAKALGNCTECYRCINLCPEKAIRIYMKKKVQWQYKGPLSGR